GSARPLPRIEHEARAVEATHREVGDGSVIATGAPHGRAPTESGAAVGTSTGSSLEWGRAAVCRFHLRRAEASRPPACSRARADRLHRAAGTAPGGRVRHMVRR